jgi:hypothetical protein
MEVIESITDEHGRIDRIYISDTMQYNVSKTDIVPGLRSDHSAVTIDIKAIAESKQAGASYWKFNNSLLENKEFSVDLKRFIENDIEKESSEIDSKQVKWEYIKYKIKTWSMKKSKEIAKRRRENEMCITKKIEKLEEQINNNPSETLYDELDRQKTSLNEIHEHKIKGLIIQSRIKHYEEGEKSTNFFLNQIKQNKRKSIIRKIIDNEQEVTEPKEIMENLKNFYSKLYQKDENVRTDDWIKKLKEDDLVPQLSVENSLKLEAPLSLEELKSTLEKC